jgi:hypothetical protein
MKRGVLVMVLVLLISAPFYNPCTSVLGRSKKATIIGECRHRNS